MSSIDWLQLSVLASADEFREVRYRHGDKSVLKALNQAPGIKFPIKAELSNAPQKRSIMIQAELGGVDLPKIEDFKKHERQFHQDRAVLFNNIHRLIRCVADCKIALRDGPGTRHALELARSFGARAWDDSPLQMRQIPNIGPVAVLKLVKGGINSLEALESAEPYRLNVILSKSPATGLKLAAAVREFPKLRIAVTMVGKVCMILYYPNLPHK